MNRTLTEELIKWQKSEKTRKIFLPVPGIEPTYLRFDFDFSLVITKISTFGTFFDQVPTISNTSDCFYLKIYISADISIGVKFWCPLVPLGLYTPEKHHFYFIKLKLEHFLRLQKIFNFDFWYVNQCFKQNDTPFLS